MELQGEDSELAKASAYMTARGAIVEVVLHV